VNAAAVLTALALSLAGAVIGTKTASKDEPPEIPTGTVDFTLSVAEEFPPTMVAEIPRCNRKSYVRGIRYLRERTEVWRWMAGISQLKTGKITTAHGCAYLKWAHRLWARRLKNSKTLFSIWFSSALAKWNCIHRGEGAWSSNTGNGYYGGLQMDLQFQRSHGWDFLRLWGTADRWPLWAQLRAAERAYWAGRGFHPWPNTARACGLL
jgi:hypothetical protein